MNKQLQKVISGLECCMSGQPEGLGCDRVPCPYCDFEDCEGMLHRDVLALLKAQEPEAENTPKPDSDIGCWYDITHNYTLEQIVSALKAQEARLVTKDDFANADEYGWLPAWAEEKIGGVVYCECITVDALKDFGVRYWTSRPTEAEREATPWQV